MEPTFHVSNLLGRIFAFLNLLLTDLLVCLILCLLFTLLPDFILGIYHFIHCRRILIKIKKWRLLSISYFIKMFLLLVLFESLADFINILLDTFIDDLHLSFMNKLLLINIFHRRIYVSLTEFILLFLFLLHLLLLLAQNTITCVNWLSCHDSIPLI